MSRGNGGGLIYAAERLLQTLTPRPIEPERMQFISTEGTLELCRRSPRNSVNLTSWLESLQQAVITGATYSQALPITDPESCNKRGQCYQGPVVLLVDGRCYSATDIFAAGFQDHEIGQIVGSSEATGAGGANVWTHDLLCRLYSGEGSPLKPLPHKMGMRIAIRQTLRVGSRAGTLLEDFGVEPKADALHKITRRDLLENDADMLAFAACKINKLPVYQLSLDEPRRQADGIQFKIKAQNITRIDFYFNGHPGGSVEVPKVGNLPPFQVKLGTKVELRGYGPSKTPGEEQCVAACKQQAAG